MESKVEVTTGFDALNKAIEHARKADGYLEEHPYYDRAQAHAQASQAWGTIASLLGVPRNEVRHDPRFKQL